MNSRWSKFTWTAKKSTSPTSSPSSSSTSPTGGPESNPGPWAAATWTSPRALTTTESWRSFASTRASTSHRCRWRIFNREGAGFVENDWPHNTFVAFLLPLKTWDLWNRFRNEAEWFYCQHLELLDNWKERLRQMSEIVRNNFMLRHPFRSDFRNPIVWVKPRMFEFVCSKKFRFRSTENLGSSTPPRSTFRSTSKSRSSRFGLKSPKKIKSPKKYKSSKKT